MNYLNSPSKIMKDVIIYSNKFSRNENLRENSIFGKPSSAKLSYFKSILEKSEKKKNLSFEKISDFSSNIKNITEKLESTVDQKNIKKFKLDKFKERKFENFENSKLDNFLNEDFLSDSEILPIVENDNILKNEKICFFLNNKKKKICKKKKFEINLFLFIKNRNFESSKLKTYKCNLCPKKFDKPSALGGHTAKHHPEHK